MNIKEIITIPSTEGKLWDYQKFFNNSEYSHAFNELKYAIAIDKFGGENYGLFTDATLVSYLSVDKRDSSEYFQITYSETDRKFRRQGCFRYLVMKVLNRHKTVLSDEHQTTEAETAWKALIEYPSDRIQFKMYHQKTHNIEPIDVDKVWNGTNTYVLLITNTHITEEYIALENARDQERYRRKHNRHFEGIWFGPQSSSIYYNNP